MPILSLPLNRHAPCDHKQAIPKRRPGVAGGGQVKDLRCLVPILMTEPKRGLPNLWRIRVVANNEGLRRKKGRYAHQPLVGRLRRGLVTVEEVDADRTGAYEFWPDSGGAAWDISYAVIHSMSDNILKTHIHARPPVPIELRH